MTDVFSNPQESLENPPTHTTKAVSDDAAGMLFPIGARRIWATGTTATDTVVLY